MRKSVLAAVLALPLASSAFADSGQTFQGTNDTNRFWFRPVGAGPGLLGSTTEYQKQGFRLYSAANCIFYSQQSYDGYLHLYRNSFNPGSQLTNLLAGNDDDASSFGIGTSVIGPIALPADEYFIVTSAFASGQVGTFTTTVHCDGSDQPVQGDCNGYSYTGIPDDKEICLLDRFLVAVNGISSHPTDGIGTPVRMGSSDTGIFWFYNPLNFELTIKVINACGLPGFFNYWVFASALTNQSYNLLVFDTEHPEFGINNYSNAFPNLAPAVADTQAFPSSGCP